MSTVASRRYRAQRRAPVCPVCGNTCEYCVDLDAEDMTDEALLAGVLRDAEPVDEEEGPLSEEEVLRILSEVAHAEH
jgi:hypothetical protein